MGTKKISRGMLFLIGICLGIIAGAAFGVIIMKIELTKEQTQKYELLEWCGDKFEELGDNCLNKIELTRDLCLFSNDLHFKEIEDKTGSVEK